LKLRGRTYNEFKKDPLGKEYREELERLKNAIITDPFVSNIKFIEDAAKNEQRENE